MAERPKDLIYARDEKPPAVSLITIGFQHVAVICPYLVMVALVAEAAKLPQEAARNAMGLAMIAVAFLTVLQSLRLGPIGSGYLCPPVSFCNLSAVGHAGRVGFWISCGMRHGDLRRRMRDRGRPAAQQPSQILSSGSFRRGDYCRRN